jgi:hypothetical protein
MRPHGLYAARPGLHAGLSLVLCPRPAPAAGRSRNLPAGRCCASAFAAASFRRTGFHSLQYAPKANISGKTGRWI